MNRSLLDRLVRLANSRKNGISRAPTMLLPPEQYFLYLLARDYYSAEGDIFDGGICLGGCTDCFAQGLAARDDLPERPLVHAYDLAVVTVESFFKKLGIERRNGESTLDIIEANIAAMPRNERIVFHHGDILRQQYPDVIEIMFLDVCKTKNINFGIQQLFSRLIPEKSVVVHQDYIHPWNPYIHATMGRLEEYFEPVGAVWFNSMVYLLKKEIPKEALAYHAYEHEPTDVLRKYILLQARRMNHKAQLTELYLACAVMLFDKGEYRACLDLLSMLQSKECLTGELHAVTTQLCEKINRLHA